MKNSGSNTQKSRTRPPNHSAMKEPVVAILVAALIALLGKVSSEKLVWSDEFNTLDQGKWHHLVTAWDGGNREFQYYRNNRKNSYVRDGILYLRPTLTTEEHDENFLNTGSITYPECNMKPCTSSGGADIVKPIQSARISSNYAFKYGRAEIRAKLPRGNWIWPAIWMLPKSSVYGGWPRSGEIDIMETKGNADYRDSKGVNQGIVRMGSTLHWGPDSSHNKYSKTHWGKSIDGSGRDLADDFHNYGLEWGDNFLKFTFDGEEIGIRWAPQNGFWSFGEFDKNPGGTNIWQKGNWMAPFDQEFQFILNVAVGGNFFGEGMGNRPWKWDGHPMRDFWNRRGEWLPTWHGEDVALKIDYIRVYQ